MNEFHEDDLWQREMRDAILVPDFYDRRWPHKYEFIPHTDKRAAGGVDTIVTKKDGGLITIDEKIVRWPEPPRVGPYTAYALEVLSNSNPGREKDGWMKTNTVDYLLYCFADEKNFTLSCHLINFPVLKKWFWENEPTANWGIHIGTQINKTLCRVVKHEYVNDAGALTTIVTCQRTPKPNIGALVAQYGGYMKIPPEAWEQYNAEMERARTNMRYGDGYKT